MNDNCHSATRRLAAIAMVGALALSAVACSDDDQEGGAKGGSESSEPSPAPSEPGGPDTGEPIPSAGCESGGAAAAPVLKEKRFLQSGGVERWYLLSTPAAEAGKPLPLVFGFHGFIEGADVHSQTSKYGEFGQAQGFVVVMPHGTGQLASWNTDPSVEANPDLQYVLKLLDTVAAERCIDLSRVYATGLSMGGFMSSVVACTLADRFAAVAPVAGIRVPEPCNPSRPVPILTFHGTADKILPFNGGPGNLSDVLGGGDPATTTTAPPADLDGEGHPAFVRDWAEIDGCGNTPTDTEVSPEVTLRTYPCPEGAAVEFYVVEDGGHTWPGSEFNKNIENIVGYTTFDIVATELTWQFFQRFRLADPAQPSTE